MHRHMGIHGLSQEVQMQIRESHLPLLGLEQVQGQGQLGGAHWAGTQRNS